MNINEIINIINLLESPGAWDYYSQINGEYAIQSYDYLYQYYYDEGYENPNDKIDGLIHEIMQKIGSDC